MEDNKKGRSLRMARKSKYGIFMEVKNVEEKTLEELASEVGVTKSTIYKYLKESGKECKRGSSRVKERNEEIIESIEALGDVSDMKISDIRRALGKKWHWSQVSAALEVGGIKYRTSGVHSKSTSSRILELFDSGMKPKEIVTEVGVSRQHVYQIVNDYRGKEWQKQKKNSRKERYAREYAVLDKEGLDLVLATLSENQLVEAAAYYGISEQIIKDWLLVNVPDGVGGVDWGFISDLRYEAMVRKRYPYMFTEEVEKYSISELSKKYNEPIMNLYRIVRRLGVEPKGYTVRMSSRKEGREY